jgi:hypothetical protein
MTEVHESESHLNGDSMLDGVSPAPQRVIAPLAVQQLRVEAPCSDPSAAGPALAVVRGAEDTEYLVFDEASDALIWVARKHIKSATVHAPRSLIPLTNQRLWIKSKDGTSPVADGYALALSTDSASAKYLVCTGDDATGQLVWVDEDNVGGASITQPSPSLTPTKKVAAAGVGGGSAAALSTAVIALLQALNVNVSPELSAAIAGVVTALAAFVAAYARRDPMAIDTPAAAEAAAGAPA